VGRHGFLTVVVGLLARRRGGEEEAGVEAARLAPGRDPVGDPHEIRSGDTKAGFLRALADGRGHIGRFPLTVGVVDATAGEHVVARGEHHRGVAALHQHLQPGEAVAHEQHRRRRSDGRVFDRSFGVGHTRGTVSGGIASLSCSCGWIWR
jgi:hypothetical protein